MIKMILQSCKTAILHRKRETFVFLFGMVLGYVVLSNMLRHKSTPKKYVIHTEDGTVYKTDTFRIYGNSIIFDTNKQRVITNHYVITCNIEE